MPLHTRSSLCQFISYIPCRVLHALVLAFIYSLWCQDETYRTVWSIHAQMRNSPEEAVVRQSQRHPVGGCSKAKVSKAGPAQCEMKNYSSIG